MVAATGGLGAAASPAVQGTSRGGGLDAQLARYEKQLAECINCASAKTPEGRQAIDDLYGKIHDLKAKIEEARNDGPVRAAPVPDRTAPAGGTDTLAQGEQTTRDQPVRRASINGTVGSVIDVYG